MKFAPGEREEPPYIQEFLTSKWNVTASLGAAALAVLASFPYGLPGFIFVGTAYAAVEGLALLYVPGMSTFRYSVRRKYAAMRYQAQIDSLLKELDSRGQCDPTSKRMRVYLQTLERIDALERMVKARTCALSVEDIDRLKDVTRDYLARWLAIVSANERQSQLSRKEIADRLRSVEDQLAATTDERERRQLLQARKDYQRLLESSSRLSSRMFAIEAAMVSMPDIIEEVFQQAVSMPMASDASARLRESVDRLAIEENLEADISEELDTIGVHVPSPAAAKASAAPAAPRPVAQSVK